MMRLFRMNKPSPPSPLPQGEGNLSGVGIPQNVGSGRPDPYKRQFDVGTGLALSAAMTTGLPLKKVRGEEIWRFALMASALLLILCSLAAANSTYAQAGVTPTPRAVSDNEVNRIAKGLYCPVCQNVPLEVCETEACARWREQVRDLIAQGDTEAQIREYFVEHFGAQTVGVPTNPTAQLLTVTLPLALIVVVGGLVGANLIGWRRRRPPVYPEEVSVPPAGNEPLDDYHAQLEEELRKRE
ncbi:MAG: cytochrome c-type biogenesis protein CcmH [Chloroflexota bacterium]